MRPDAPSRRRSRCCGASGRASGGSGWTATTTAHGAQGGPVPAHRIEVWLGVQGPRMLELLGTKADGWVPSLPRVSLDDLDRGHEIIDLAANEAGRDQEDPPSPQRQRHHHRRGFSRVPHRPARAVGRATHRPGNRPRNRQLHPLAGGDLIEQVRRFTELTEEVRASVARERAAG